MNAMPLPSARPARGHPDAFALTNSDLNAFLYADVGIELNGSPLTILSVLARLGQDPWAEAARWARLSKAAATERLTQCIARMPLSRQGLAEAGATAAKLTLLLPDPTRLAARPRAAGAPGPVQFGRLKVPAWMPMVLVFAALVLGLAINGLVMPRIAATLARPATPTLQSATPAAGAMAQEKPTPAS